MFRIYVYTVLACYILYYCGTLLYDLYIRRVGEKADISQDEEAIDITDELESFQPIIVKHPPPVKKRTIMVLRAEMMMTGGIETDQLVPQISDFSTQGRLAELGQMVELWAEG
ncbi:MAG: hypothetical protein MR450_10885 [Prevotella sp.]|nr:hypothetical protein [Prevotella sp.]